MIKLNMNRKFIVLVGVLSLSFFSCDRVESSDSDLVHLSIGAKVEQEVTRGSYDPNGDRSKFNFSWNGDDKIALIVSGVTRDQGEQFVVDADGDSTTISGDIEPWSGEKNIMAIYPYSSECGVVDGEYVNVSLSTQTIDASSSIVENSLMVAAASGATLQGADMSGIPDLIFNQVMSFFYIELKDIPSGSSVTSVELYSDDAIFITSAKVDMWSGKIIGGEVMSRSVMAAVVNQSGSTAALNFALLPVDLSSTPFAMKVTTSSGYYYTKNFNVGTNFKRNTFMYLEDGAISIYFSIF